MLRVNLAPGLQGKVLSLDLLLSPKEPITNETLFTADAFPPLPARRLADRAGHGVARAKLVPAPSFTQDGRALQAGP